MTFIPTSALAPASRKAGRLLGPIFFVLGGAVILCAAVLAVTTFIWTASLERIEGTVVAARHGRAVAQARLADGHSIRVLDTVRTSPPPVIGSTRGVGFPSGHEGDAVVLGAFRDWFVPGLLAFVGTIFAFVGLVFMIVGPRARVGQWSDRPYAEPHGDQGQTTIINNHYGEDGPSPV